MSEPIPDSPIMSLRAYAKRRGVSAMAVSLAVKSGRLSKSVTRDVNGQPKIANPDLADQEWAANTNHERAPAAAVDAFEKYRKDSAPTVEPVQVSSELEPLLQQGASLSEAKSVEAYWKAKNERLKFQEAARELVDARTVKLEWADIATRIKTKLLGIPSKLKQSLPDLTLAHLAALDAQIRETLEELADDR